MVCSYQFGILCYSLLNYNTKMFNISRIQTAISKSNNDDTFLQALKQKYKVKDTNREHHFKHSEKDINDKDKVRQQEVLTKGIHHYSAARITTKSEKVQAQYKSVVPKKPLFTDHNYNSVNFGRKALRISNNNLEIKKQQANERIAKEDNYRFLYDKETNITKTNGRIEHNVNQNSDSPIRLIYQEQNMTERKGQSREWNLNSKRQSLTKQKQNRSTKYQIQREKNYSSIANVQNILKNIRKTLRQ